MKRKVESHFHDGGVLGSNFLPIVPPIDSDKYSTQQLQQQYQRHNRARAKAELENDNCNELKVLIGDPLMAPHSQGSRARKRLNDDTSIGNLSRDQKKQLCIQKLNNPTMTQSKLRQFAKEHFNLSYLPSQSTISNILSKKDRYLIAESNVKGYIKSERRVKYPELDQALANWVLQKQASHICVSGDMIKEKGKEIVEQLGIDPKKCAFSNGWLSSFKKRHGFRKFNVYDEISGFITRDIYNFDECGLLYCMAPDKSVLSLNGQQSQSEESLRSSRSRFTIGLCCNGDGSDCLAPLIIGNTLHPPSFMGKRAQDLGFPHYYNNKKALMTSTIFQDWVMKFDRRMSNLNRRVVLIIDNSPSHILLNVQLTNVKIVLLPSNSAGKYQPMENGIILALKRRYRQRQLSHAVDLDEAGEADMYKVDRLRAMRWIVESWVAIPQVVLKYAWKCTGLIEHYKDMIVDDRPEIIIDDEISHRMTFLRLANPIPVQNLLNLECESVVHVEIDDPDVIHDSYSSNGAKVIVEKQEVDEDSEIDKKNILSDNEKLKCLRDTISILRDDNLQVDEKTAEMISFLRQKQFQIREQKRLSEIHHIV